jgi:ATP-binding cassette subfamily C exporter for protease/lipase
MNKKQNSNKKTTELAQAFWKMKSYFIRAGVFGLVASLLILAPTLYMFQVYDRVVNSRNHMTLLMLTLLVLFAYVVMEVLDWARGETMREAGEKLDKVMAPRIFNVIYQANLKRMGLGVQPMSDFRTIRDFLPMPVFGALMEFPASIVFLLLIFGLSPVKGWVAVMMATVMGVVGWLNARSTNPPLMEANRASGVAQQYADGTLKNAQVIESMGMLRDIHLRWIDKQREFLGLQAIASDRAGMYQAMTKFFQTLMGSLLLGLGAWLSMRGLLLGGGAAIIVGSVLGGRVVSPIVQIVTQWRSVSGARESWMRLEQLLQQFPADEPNMALPAPRGHLTVESLVASAPGGGVPILKGIAFALNPGEVLVVIGPSAAGKTTLARMLVGLWPAASGKVRLDGADVFTWNKEELGPNMGYLPQGVELLEGTLSENIARFGEHKPAKVEAAARLVGLHDFIMSLPKGYDSPVGRDGAILSGGQRQRVALARALYGDPVFVVLDEPNSSLDDEGDAALAVAIRKLKEQGTTFVIMTHRTSVLAVADKLLVLREGAQQAFGPRDEVLAALNKAVQQQKQSASQATNATGAVAPGLSAP